MPAAGIHDFEAGQVWGAALGDRTRRTRRIEEASVYYVRYRLIPPSGDGRKDRLREITRESMAWWVRDRCAVLLRRAPAKGSEDGSEA